MKHEPSWRLETSGSPSAQNRVRIQPVPDNDPYSEIQYVTIEVIPWSTQQAPTLPLFAPGTQYCDRNDVAYTIVSARVKEIGDGCETTGWTYLYVAAIGAHELARVIP